MVDGQMSDYARCVGNQCGARQEGLFTHSDKGRGVLFRKTAFMQHIKNHHVKCDPEMEDQIKLACLDFLMNPDVPATLFECRGLQLPVKIFNYR